MNKLKLARKLVLVSYFCLLFLSMAWVTVFSTNPRLPVSIMLLIYTGPLLLPMKGLLAGGIKTHTWTCMLVLLYFIHGIVEAWSSPAERWLALSELGLSIVLFFSCFYFVLLSKKNHNES